MLKLGDRVGVELRGKYNYGIVCDICRESGAVSILIGVDRVVQVRECDCFFDERGD